MQSSDKLIDFPSNHRRSVKKSNSQLCALSLHFPNIQSASPSNWILQFQKFNSFSIHIFSVFSFSLFRKCDCRLVRGQLVRSKFRKREYNVYPWTDANGSRRSSDNGSIDVESERWWENHIGNVGQRFRVSSFCAYRKSENKKVFVVTRKKSSVLMRWNVGAHHVKLCEMCVVRYTDWAIQSYFGMGSFMLFHVAMHVAGAILFSVQLFVDFRKILVKWHRQNEWCDGASEQRVYAIYSLSSLPIVTAYPYCAV